MTLESSKNLGGVGAILMLIGFLPVLSSYTFGILGFVGLIMVLVALYGLAGIYKDRGIFNNSIYGVITGVVGVVIAVIVLFVAVLNNITTFLEKIYPSWNGSWSTISSLSGMTPNTTNIGPSDVLPFVEGVIAVLLVLWIFVIIWAFFARRSLKSLSTKSNVGLFSTAGLLLIIGAVLTIVLIGLLLMWIAILLMAIAFFQIKTQPEETQAPMSPPPPSTPTPV